MTDPAPVSKKTIPPGDVRDDPRRAVGLQAEEGQDHRSGAYQGLRRHLPEGYTVSEGRSEGPGGSACECVEVRNVKVVTSRQGGSE